MSIYDDNNVALFLAHHQAMFKTLCTSVLETVRFYADNGDLLSAAHIVLVFYEELNDMPQVCNFFALQKRILKSYFDML